MPGLTAALMFEDISLIEALAASDCVAQILLVGSQQKARPGLSGKAMAKVRFYQGDFFSGPSVAGLIQAVTTDHILLILTGQQVRPGQHFVERFLSVAEDSGAGPVSSAFKDDLGESVSDQPLIDYQTGSIRDSFDFGSVMLIS